MTDEPTLTVAALKNFLMRVDDDAEVWVDKDHCGEWLPVPVVAVTMEVCTNGYERITINVER